MQTHSISGQYPRSPYLQQKSKLDQEQLIKKIEDATDRLRDGIYKTPLLFSHALSELIGGDIYLKLESEQWTGSFKARGSLNKLRILSESGVNQEVITASTGNHGLGFARAVDLTGVSGTVFLPKTASPFKVKRLSHYPVRLEFHDGDSLSTELKAKATAASEKAIWVSPYNDYDVIAGQGSIAIEILDELEHFDNIFITVGGGGLISGIGSYLKHQDKNIQVIACQPENSPEMTLSLEAGRIVDFEDAKPTLSDGSAGGIEPGSVTFDICREITDHSILVSEEQIKDAIRWMIREHGKIIEGSAAVTIASLLIEKERFAGKTSVLVLCGGNIEFEKLRSILNET